MAIEYIDERHLAWTVGDRLRKSRDVAGFSQEEMAALLGYQSPSTIRRWETDAYLPKKPTLEAWARLTHFPVQWLMTGSTHPPNDPRPITSGRRKRTSARRSCYAPFTLLSADDPARRAA